jgi:hypothetical protein
MSKQETGVRINDLSLAIAKEGEDIKHRRGDNPYHDIEHQVPPQWQIANHIVAHNAHGHNTEIPARNSRDYKPGKAPQQSILRRYSIDLIHNAT